MATSESSNLLFEGVEWDADHIPASLDTIYGKTIDNAISARDWYRQGSRPKKKWAQRLRVTTIIATGLGGIIPVLSEALAKFDLVLDPIWSTVLLAMAATALGLDRFFGFSSAWIRYIKSELELTEKINQFHYEWEKERLQWVEQTPTLEQAQLMVEKCATFSAEVSQLVQDETQQWINEFQRVLKKLDETKSK